jgi:hypothetical protein
VKRVVPKVASMAGLLADRWVARKAVRKVERWAEEMVV